MIQGTTSYEKYYSFVCGNGQKVQCLDTTCKEECRLFKGLGTNSGESGIIAMRNVTFVKGYQSPIQASDKNLDFIVSFYHAGTLVSSMLINAYTVKFEPLR